MKKLLLFSLLYLASWNSSLACGYYPYGEDVRFSLLKPNLIFPHSSSLFFYNTNLFSYTGNPENNYLSGKYEENLNLWSDLLEGKADKESIYFAVYEASRKDLKKTNSDNNAIRILNLKENNEILDYLLFAKSCSYLNGQFDDPWERDNKNLFKRRDKMIRKCLKKTLAAKSLKLKKRYAHLALRMSFYNRDEIRVRQLFELYFDRNNPADALDFWALHFKLQFDEPSAARNIDVAMVFANSPEKRFSTAFFYTSEIDFEETLNQAKNDRERAALYYTKTIKSPVFTLEDLKKSYEYGTPEDELLFAALREVNKLEDWILTPYYTNFEPSFTSNWDEMPLSEVIQKRIAKDRKYSLELSNWIDKIKKERSYKNPWWSTLTLYTKFLAGDNEKLSAHCLLERSTAASDSSRFSFLSQISVLSKIANSNGENLDKLGLEQLVFKNQNTNLFLFAAGKELEKKGNKLEAIALLSKIETDDYWENGINWKSDNHNQTLHSDYYYNYFFYMDAAYSADEIQSLMTVLTNSKEPTKFDQWKFSTLYENKNRLYDMLGVMYMRKDDLPKALEAFKKVEDSFWNSDQFVTYMNEDPFANNFISESVGESGEHYTKPELVEKLVSLKSKLNTSTGDEKAKTAFLVANCYRNMTYYGTAWLMRRYYWSGAHNDAGLEDDAEYRHADLAKKYYQLAYKSAKTKDFAALSLRMAGRCEKYKLYDTYETDSYGQSWEDEILIENKLYQKLEKDFPEDYGELLSNCASLKRYFSSVR